MANNVDSKDIAGRTLRRRQRLEEVLRQRQEDLTLVLANIHDPHNVSAIYRSCDAFGVAMVYLYYTSAAFPVLGRKSSASARKWVRSARYANAPKMIADLQEKGFQVLATSFSEKAKPLREWNFLLPTAVILGNEHSGVDAELLPLATGELYIPMHGMIQSFNVSVAAAIILAEAARQREDAGFYAREAKGEENMANYWEEWLEK